MNENQSNTAILAALSMILARQDVLAAMLADHISSGNQGQSKILLDAYEKSAANLSADYSRKLTE